MQLRRLFVQKAIRKKIKLLGKFCLQQKVG
jgi:hypothetical protein